MSIREDEEMDPPKRSGLSCPLEDRTGDTSQDYLSRRFCEIGKVIVSTYDLLCYSEHEWCRSERPMSLNEVLSEGFSLAHQRFGTVIVDIVWKLLWLAFTAVAV